MGSKDTERRKLQRKRQAERNRAAGQQTPQAIAQRHQRQNRAKRKCEAKQQYQSQRDAELVMVRMQSSTNYVAPPDGMVMGTYQCPHCNKWHVGTTNTYNAPTWIAEKKDKKAKKTNKRRRIVAAATAPTIGDMIDISKLIQKDND